MCGIVGGVSDRNVLPILIEGLKRLEYRGYDSAGVAFRENSKISLIKAKGRVLDLENKLPEKKIKSNQGIAHTRWATHGVPSEKNAHPQISENKIFVVHNGIIENHENLRKKNILSYDAKDFDLNFRIKREESFYFKCPT